MFHFQSSFFVPAVLFDRVGGKRANRLYWIPGIPKLDEKPMGFSKASFAGFRFLCEGSGRGWSRKMGHWKKGRRCIYEKIGIFAAGECNAGGGTDWVHRRD